MTDIAALIALTLIARWGCLLMTWREARAHSQMLREMARIKHEYKQQLGRWSRTPGGSTYSPGGLTPSCSSGATGPGVEARSLEEPTPPPVPPSSKPAPSSAKTWSNQTSVGAGDSPPLRPRTHRATPQAPVGGGHTSATPPTGLHPRTGHV
jgi:hypothetical protein